MAHTLLTPTELGPRIGLKTRTIYNRLHEHRDLPIVTRTGKHSPRFAEEDVAAWLASRRCMNNADAQAVATPRHRGRPTKGEEIARRGGLVVALPRR
jgi:predicted DNA-binding transcriptional regulator AlpA